MFIRNSRSRIRRNKNIRRYTHLKCGNSFDEFYSNSIEEKMCPFCFLDGVKIIKNDLIYIKIHTDPSKNSKTKRGGKLGNKKRIYIAEREKWICYLCKNYIDPKETGRYRVTLEHIIPRSRKGGNNLDNLTISHSICNNMRGNKTIEEFWAENAE